MSRPDAEIDRRGFRPRDEKPRQVSTSNAAKAYDGLQEQKRYAKMSDSISDIVAPQLPTLAQVFAGVEWIAAKGRRLCGRAPRDVDRGSSGLSKRSASEIVAFSTLHARVERRPDQRRVGPFGGRDRRGRSPDRDIDAETETSILLAALENFATREIAAVLECPESEVRQLVDAAGKEISAQIAAKILIIEDEPVIAIELEAIVTESVIGSAASPHSREAVALVERVEPGLILADIQLADGSSGIDAAHDILQRIQTPLIFITRIRSVC